MQPKNSEARFDEMLKTELKKHRELIRDDFAQELLAKVEKIEQQKAIQKVVVQERLSLAAFIILPLIIIGAMIMFPSLIVNSGQIISKMYYVIGQSMHIITAKWQLFSYYCLVFLACLYTFYQMTAAEK
jgi:uncharacterized membrane protein